MSEARKMERIVKEILQEQALRRHLSDGALVRYNDGRLDDPALRWHLERHLELCTSCRERFEAVTHIHLSEEELRDYHDGQVSNPHTLARIRAHLEAERCPLCTSWLAEFQQAEDEAAAWLATHARVSEEETPAAVAQGLGAMRQRLAMRVQRPWAVAGTAGEQHTEMSGAAVGAKGSLQPSLWDWDLAEFVLATTQSAPGADSMALAAATHEEQAEHRRGEGAQFFGIGQLGDVQFFSDVDGNLFIRPPTGAQFEHITLDGQVFQLTRLEAHPTLFAVSEELGEADFTETVKAAIRAPGQHRLSLGVAH